MELRTEKQLHCALGCYGSSILREDERTMGPMALTFACSDLPDGFGSCKALMFSEQITSLLCRSLERAGIVAVVALSLLSILWLYASSVSVLLLAVIR